MPVSHTYVGSFSGIFDQRYFARLTEKPFGRIQPVRLRYHEVVTTMYSENNLPDKERSYSSSSLFLQNYEHSAFLLEQCRSWLPQVLSCSDSSIDLHMFITHAFDILYEHMEASIIQSPSLPSESQAVLRDFALGRVAGARVLAAYG